MSIVKTVNGDIISMFKNRDFDVMLHGCNCFHTMGAGVAGRIAKAYPEALISDKSTEYGIDKLGCYSTASTNYGVIVNAYTQFLPGKESPSILYSSIGKVFSDLNRLLNSNIANILGIDDVTIGIPKIGSGIAGGSWNKIEKIINEVAPDLRIVLVEYRP